MVNIRLLTRARTPEKTRATASDSEPPQHILSPKVAGSTCQVYGRRGPRGTLHPPTARPKRLNDVRSATDSGRPADDHLVEDAYASVVRPNAFDLRTM